MPTTPCTPRREISWDVKVLNDELMALYDISSKTRRSIGDLEANQHRTNIEFLKTLNSVREEMDGMRMMQKEHMEMMNDFLTKMHALMEILEKERTKQELITTELVARKNELTRM